MNYIYQDKLDYEKGVGVVLGSYSPLHNGHLDIISRARKFLDSLVVAVGVNPEKIPFLTPKQRVNLVKKSVKSMFFIF